MQRDGGARVLLVEDDDDNRELMGEVLQDAGYEVLLAASGAAGLRMLAEHSVAVPVTDVGMPGLGWLEVARAAKAIAPTVPVVVVTGFADREDIKSARGRDIDAVLVKPVTPDALTAAVDQMVKRR